MPGKTRYTLLAITALVLLAATARSAAADPVQDPIPVRPNMTFIALVNGQTSNAVVKVACPVGAVYGHPLAGQTVEVETVLPPTPAYAGYTGSAATQIDALFAAPSGAVANPPIVMPNFFVPTAIATTFLVPCGGTGTVSFVPIPTSPTARGVAVSVAYANIAV